mmetsp:Transcript_38621/g.111442  ORF Transcript_38621/g.111442 Transcript_38621/m.111442 type:complete len:299 (+) Transcript_38621:593-1489(+)
MASAKVALGHHGLASRADHGVVLVGHLLHEGVAAEHAAVDLVAQLGAEGAREILQALHLLFKDMPSSLHAAVPQEGDDAVAQLQRHVVLRKEFADLHVILGPLDRVVADVGQQARDTAQEGGEHREAEQQRTDREVPLLHVLRVEVVRRGRKLGQSPMKRHRVMVQHPQALSRLVVLHQLHEPRVLDGLALPEGVPRASDEVVGHDQRQQQLEKAEEFEQGLRLRPSGEDEIGELGRQSQKLHDPEQAQNAQQPDDAEQLPEPGNVNRIGGRRVQVGGHHDPVRTNNADIDEERSKDV